MGKFKGIIPAIITPFTKDGEIFKEGIKNEIEYLASHGMTSAFICGSYGAFPTMTTEERKVVAEVALKECHRNYMKGIVQIGSPSMIIAIELAKHAENVGADAISSVVPFYYSSTFYTTEDFLNYFKMLIESVSIDVHCYNNPRTTGYNVTPDFLKELIEIGVKGIKDGGSNMGGMLEMMNVIGVKDFDYYPSSTSSLITGFLLGSESCISGVSLSVPELVNSVYVDMKNKNVGRALKNWKKIMKVRSILGQFGSRAIASYTILNSRGVGVGYCRLPWQRSKYYDDMFLINEVKKIGSR